MPTYKAQILAERADIGILTSLLTEMLDPPPAVSSREADGGWLLDVYFAEPPDPAGLAAVADCFPHFAAIRHLRPDILPDEDWVATVQRGLHPIEAGRFFIHGSHDRAAANGKPFAIEVDAGQAFGTAHHGTTRGCLLLLDRLAKKQEILSTLDLGTGSGVLAIAAAKVFRNTVLATDIDPIAIDVARENFARNGVARLVTSIVAAGLAHPTVVAKASFDLIMANILAGPLLKLAADIARVAAPGGHLILSGLLDSQARQVRARYLAQGFSLATQLSLEGWTALHMRRSES